MTAGEESDAQLIARVLNGEEAAFTALMRRHKSWLFVFIRRHVASPEDAYDILQDSFVSAWGALKRYDPERPFQVWLRRIALNKCRDKGRRDAVRRRVLKVFGAGEEPPEPADPGPSHETVQIATEALGRLNRAMDKLPAHLKEALVLTTLQGLSQKEAGEVLGVGAKVVEMRAYRARKLLAEALERSDAADVERMG